MDWDTGCFLFCRLYKENKRIKVRSKLIDLLPDTIICLKTNQVCFQHLELF